MDGGRRREKAQAGVSESLSFAEVYEIHETPDGR